MRTIFSIQGAGNRSAFLAQASGGDQISEAERNKLLNDLADAGEKLRAMNAWIGATPNPQAVLGADYQAYQDASSNMSRFGSTAATVQQKLASSDPAFWTVTAQQWNDTQSWMQFVNVIYGIIQRHGAASVAAKPGYPVPTASSGGIPMPVLIGGGLAAALLVGLAILK